MQGEETKTNEINTAVQLRKMFLNINGVDRMFICNPEKETLSDVLRRLGLTGTKVGCGIGVCGACSVILDGKVIRSCTRKIKTIKDYSSVTTIEGIGTPQHLHPLQVAWIRCGGVQCGFCTPGFIVSAYALLQNNPSPTREEVRDWFQRHCNVCRCTGYKPLVDAVMVAASVMRGETDIEELAEPVPADRAYYGLPLSRPNAVGKVCGLTDYGEDMADKMPPGTLHAVIVQPRITAHALIKEIYTEAAEKMEGVVKVVTYKDVQGTNYLPMMKRHKRAQNIAQDTPVFAHDKIYRYGDVIAVVVADTKEHARAAAALVTMDYKELPAYLTYLEAVMPGAGKVHEETPNIFCEQPIIKGDEPTQEVVDKSAFQVSGSFSTCNEPHLSIEGDFVQAYWDEEGVLTIHCKCQAIGANRGMVSYAIGLPKDKVRIVLNPVGGSFGWSMWPGTYAMAAVCVMSTGAPVELSLTYEEHMHYSGKRCASYSNGTLACDEDGKITGAIYEVALDHGPYSDTADIIMGRAMRFSFHPYYVPNARGLARVASTNNVHGVAYRGFGSPQSYTMGESLIDMLAEKAGIDPFEFRWRNIARPGDTTICQNPYEEYPMEQIMERMRPLYKQALDEAKAASSPGKLRGVGLSFGGYACTSGGHDMGSVAVELTEGDIFVKYDTWQDMGQGGDIGSLMVTLEALKPLGVTPDRIKLVQNDSKYCPDTGMSAGSRCHYMNGHATRIAATELIAAMKKPDGTYRTYKEMLAEGIETKYEAQFQNNGYKPWLPMNPNTGKGDIGPQNYGLFMSEVEVDITTGKTTVLGLTCVDDIGVVGNIAALDGQGYGGLSHCIGYALSEVYYDIKTHNNIRACGIPYARDVPDKITLYHCENPRPYGPFGSVGASELYQSGGHVSILNAIYNACGVRIFDLPATPEKVKNGIHILATGGEIAPPKPYFLGSNLFDELEYIEANPV